MEKNNNKEEQGLIPETSLKEQTEVELPAKKLSLEKQKEIELIKKASPEELAKIVKEKKLSTIGELTLLERRLSPIFLLYGRYHGFHTKTIYKIISHNIWRLLYKALDYAENKEEAMQVFLDYGSYGQICTYIKYRDVPQYPERAAVESEDPEQLEKLMKLPTLSRFACYDIIKRGYHSLIMNIIPRGLLHYREQTALIEYGTRTEAEFMIEHEKRLWRKTTLQTMKVIRFGREEEVMKLISSRKLGKEAEAFFFKIASPDLLKYYQKKYKVIASVQIDTNHFLFHEKLFYLQENEISTREQKRLLKLGSFREIETYVKNHPLAYESELKLVKHGLHEHLMAYLENHSLSDVAQVELILRNNDEEILYFIAKYPFCDLAENALLKYGSDKVVDAWLDKVPPNCNI